MAVATSTSNSTVPRSLVYRDSAQNFSRKVYVDLTAITVTWQLLQLAARWISVLSFIYFLLNKNLKNVLCKSRCTINIFLIYCSHLSRGRDDKIMHFECNIFVAIYLEIRRHSSGCSLFNYFFRYCFYKQNITSLQIFHSVHKEYKIYVRMSTSYF